MKIGTIVKIKDLEASVFYNGQYGLVIGASSIDSKQNHRYPVRLFSKQFSNSELKVRPKNLETSGDDPTWKHPNMGLSIFELCESSLIRGKDSCNGFVKAVWDEISESPPSHCLTPDAMDLIKASQGRKMFWIGLNAIGHHFLLERCYDKWRLYQASLLVNKGRGYTAGEWCFLQKPSFNPDRIVPLASTHAWKRWGGGRFLNDDDIEDVFKIIRQWQDLTHEILKHELLPIFSKEFDEEILNCLKDKGTNNIPEKLKSKTSEAVQRIVSWSSNALIKMKKGGLHLILDNDQSLNKIHNRSDISYPVKNGRGETLFKIKSSSLLKCNILTHKLSGEDVNHAIFLRMLNCGLWWQNRVDPETLDYTGFFMRACDLNIVSSCEKGVQALERLQGERQDFLKALAI